MSLFSFIHIQPPGRKEETQLPCARTLWDVSQNSGKLGRFLPISSAANLLLDTSGMPPLPSIPANYSLPSNLGVRRRGAGWATTTGIFSQDSCQHYPAGG